MGHNLPDIGSDYTEYRKRALEFNKKLSEGLVLLSRYGWYLHPNMEVIEVVNLTKLAKTCDQQQIDDWCQKFYSNIIQSESNNLSKLFPERKSVILEGAIAHKKKMYFASTLVFLSQSDGICEGHLFKTRKDKKAIKEYLKTKGFNDFVSSFLKPITEESSIDVYHPEKSKFFSALNRHGVVHGYDFDYGTELNSLKAFSLLCFVADSIQRIKRINTVTDKT